MREVIKGTSADWILKNCRGLSKSEAIKKCSSITGIHIDTSRRAWNKIHMNKKPSPKGSAGSFKGIKGFAELHDIDTRQKRRDEHCSTMIKKFIDGPLKEQGWYYDSEASRVSGLTTSDWARHRDSYSELQVMVNTDKGKRMTWVHPTLVDEARQIADRS